MAKTLVTDDGVPIEAVHLPQDSDLAIVIAHGFTFSWQRPAVWRISTQLNQIAGVVSFDFRGHGRSGGLSTLGDRETKDVDVAVAYARELGYERIAAVGFSMGASVVLRYAGMVGGLDAAVSVSGPGRWYYRGTERMRRVHFAAERRVGRLATRMLTNTRISPVRWDPTPMPPDEAAAQISPTPLLIVHGDKDLYFPVDHAQRLYDAAREPKELWLIPGLGHAESGCRPALVDRIGRWVATAAGATAAQDLAGIAAQAPPVPAADVPPGAEGQSAAAQQAAEAAEAAGAAAAAGIGPAEGLPGELTVPAGARPSAARRPTSRPAAACLRCSRRRSAGR
jgi:pimeloyl-ACP methyl ester carboxylesterase